MLTRQREYQIYKLKSLYEKEQQLGRECSGTLRTRSSRVDWQGKAE